MEKVLLRHGRERSVLRRHPWIFSGALERPDREITAGETVEVVDISGGTLGLGWWSTESQIRVRMFSFSPLKSGESAEDVIAAHVRAAISRRIESGFLKDAKGAARLINAENDFLPGTVVDMYGSWAVCQFTTAGADANKALIAKTILEAAPGCLGVAERRDTDARRREKLSGEPRFAVLAGATAPDEIVIEEAQAKFIVDVRNGHKTGFYLDQRNARTAVAEFANRRDVLNTFSYTGGFGIYAALAGAKSVVQVDSSAEALALAQKNASLNGFTQDGVISYEEADVFKYLRKCRDAAKSFDLIVLDPPKFADSKSQLMKAARGYKDINLLAMKLLSPGGILASFSCSGAITDAFFEQILSEAAADARRDFQIIARTGHPLDHPVALSFPEGRYLKGVIMRASK